MNGHRVALPLALLAALCCTPRAGAAEAEPSPDPSKPVTTARVGGSEADRVFRTAMQESGDRYRQARAECRARPSGERSACVAAAKSELKRERLEAKAAHDAARKKPH